MQFPLEQSLAVKKGQYVGLTVPTWAPAMQLGRLADTSWRSSRDVSGCFDYTTQFGLLGKRTSALFRCLYKGVRLTYSATFIGNPPRAEGRSSRHRTVRPGFPRRPIRQRCRVECPL